MRSVLLLCSVIITTTLSACWSKMPAECNATGFFDLPPNQQDTQFRSLPLERQLELFTCDFRYVHPFCISCAKAIAAHGDQAIPFLVSRLKKEVDVNNQEAIVYILKVMYKDGYVQNKGDAAQVIRQAIPEMKCKDSEELCNERLREIERIIAFPQ